MRTYRVMIRDTNDKDEILESYRTFTDIQYYSLVDKSTVIIDALKTLEREMNNLLKGE